MAVGRLRALFVSSAGHSLAVKTGHSRQRKISSVGIGGLVNNLSVKLVIIHYFTLTNASIASYPTLTILIVGHLD